MAISKPIFPIKGELNQPLMDLYSSESETVIEGIPLRFLNGGVLRNLNMYSFQKLCPVCSAT